MRGHGELRHHSNMQHTPPALILWQWPKGSKKNLISGPNLCFSSCISFSLQLVLFATLISIFFFPPLFCSHAPYFPYFLPVRGLELHSFCTLFSCSPCLCHSAPSWLHRSCIQLPPKKLAQPTSFCAHGASSLCRTLAVGTWRALVSSQMQTSILGLICWSRSGKNIWYNMVIYIQGNRMDAGWVQHLDNSEETSEIYKYRTFWKFFNLKSYSFKILKKTEMKPSHWYDHFESGINWLFT